jgi:L-amino acid N-acyltransferase YncA
VAVPPIIEPMTAADWPEVARIYAEGIATGDATFETQPPADWATFIRGKLPDHRLVALDPAGRVVAWATLSPVSDRCVYAGVAEVSIYVDAGARGHGIGRHLLADLVARSEEAGIWTLQTGIFPENAASLALHEACGFRRLGVRERLGRHHGRWRDVVFLERRSLAAGTD